MRPAVVGNYFPDTLAGPSEIEGANNNNWG